MGELIEVLSYTHAMKAKNLLRSRGYFSDVQKITRPGGCTFFIRVYDNPEMLRQILRDNGIRSKYSAG